MENSESLIEWDDDWTDEDIREATECATCGFLPCEHPARMDGLVCTEWTAK